MELVRGTAALSRRIKHPVLTIGNFDGVHLGHRSILETVVGRARSLGGEAVLLTFDPHPRKVLRPDSGPSLLTTLEQKIELLADSQIDVVVVEPFDLEFARTPPEVFVNEYIHRRIAPREVYVGYDFHFGKDREGSMRLLAETGPKLGFSVTIIPEITVGERSVNSTRVRDLLSRGEVEEAGELLGRPFSVRGNVVQGMQRGRGMGFPTANLAPENEILPSPGVYACAVRFLDEGTPDRGEIFPAVTNLGYRPTFDDQRDLVAEAHLLDFSDDLYGRKIELVFLSLLRVEQKFESVETLREQIGRDVEELRKWLGAHPGAMANLAEPHS
ncbi:MAG: bifunctional riboflavin kinase/FAD synthetase [Myxococcota bacterium]|nr:bifunctional riboflavin kinase/FAD synthetase [Myxococcota bacterium]